MKIHILDLPPALRPERQAFHYPAHNDDYGVEQDFPAWLAAQDGLRAASSGQADWHYLPAYWTRWHLNHDYGRQGREELQAAVSAALIDPGRTFTVCQYDDGPRADLGGARVWFASRKEADGLDAPLLATPHRRPRFFVPKKRWKASFTGRLATHSLRGDMAAALKGRPDVLVEDGDQGARHFVRLALASRMVLSPRGYGGSSFRFFEAMQLGVAPCLVGDRDTRPFKGLIDWAACSFYIDDPGRLPGLLDSLDDAGLEAMGREARRVYERDLAFGRWGRLLVKELEGLKA